MMVAVKWSLFSKITETVSRICDFVRLVSYLYLRYQVLVVVVVVIAPPLPRDGGTARTTI